MSRVCGRLVVVVGSKVVFRHSPSLLTFSPTSMPIHTCKNDSSLAAMITELEKAFNIIRTTECSLVFNLTLRSLNSMNWQEKQGSQDMQLPNVLCRAVLYHLRKLWHIRDVFAAEFLCSAIFMLISKNALSQLRLIS